MLTGARVSVMDMYAGSSFLSCGRGVPAVWRHEQGMLGSDKWGAGAAETPRYAVHGLNCISAGGP